MISQCSNMVNLSGIWLETRFRAKRITQICSPIKSYPAKSGPWERKKEGGSVLSSHLGYFLTV